MDNERYGLKELGIEETHVGDGHYCLRTPNGQEIFVTFECIEDLYKLSLQAQGKPFFAPGDWFPLNIMGSPMREFSPGKWESAIWPSMQQPEGEESCYSKKKVDRLVDEADGFLHFSDAHPLHWHAASSVLGKEFNAFSYGLREALRPFGR